MKITVIIWLPRDSMNVRMQSEALGGHKEEHNCSVENQRLSGKHALPIPSYKEGQRERKYINLTVPEYLVT